MADFFATNKGTIVGTAGEDRLTMTYNTATNDVWLRDLVDNGGGSYSGTFNGAGSNDVFFSGIEHFTFTDLSGGNDDINTGNGDDTLNGGDGNDLLFSGRGIDVIDGGNGNDMWGADKSFASTAITIDLNKATSVYLGDGFVTNIEGLNLKTGSGWDRISASDSVSMNDVIDTGSGRDVINMWAGGTDSVDGGAGVDRLKLTYSIATNDVWLNDLVEDSTGSYSGTFNGAGSNDLRFTGIEHFTFIDKSGGNDSIKTGNGNDILKGGGGNDVLNSGAGVDKVYGGAGDDMWAADKSFATSAITINLTKATSNYLDTGVVDNIEGLNLTTGSGNDKITGHKAVAMNDIVDTGAGADVITLWAGGTDSVDGGVGVDRLKLTYSIATNDVWLTNLVEDSTGSYSGTFNGAGSTDLGFAGIEHFTFIDQSGGNDIINTGNGRDVLKGGGGNDALNSGAGGDKLWGQDGNDVLRGEGGNDQMYGGAGNDTLAGGVGKDQLSGGLGDDVLTGGGWADVFIFNGAVNEGADLITDFRNRTDIIRIEGVEFSDLDIVSSNGGADTQITVDGGTVITLEGISVGTIHANDFDFV